MSQMHKTNIGKTWTSSCYKTLVVFSLSEYETHSLCLACLKQSVPTDLPLSELKSRDKSITIIINNNWSRYIVLFHRQHAAYKLLQMKQPDWPYSLLPHRWVITEDEAVLNQFKSAWSGLLVLPTWLGFLSWFFKHKVKRLSSSLL